MERGKRGRERKKEDEEWIIKRVEGLARMRKAAIESKLPLRANQMANDECKMRDVH